MEFLQTVLSFIVALGVLITIHEYGHFWVARRCGVRVLRFSVGFGKPLFAWYDKKGTEFCVAAIPLGGYVKLLDRREADVPDNLLHEEFSTKPVLQRIAVFAAGPLVNLLFAVLLYWAIFVSGVTRMAPVLGDVLPGTPASQAQLEDVVGYELTHVDGKTVLDWEGVTLALVGHIGNTGSIELGLKHPNDQHVTQRTVSVVDFLAGDGVENPLEALGVQPYQLRIDPLIGEVIAGGAAERDGLLPGDLLLSANGENIDDWAAWVQVVRDSPEIPIAISLERDGRVVDLQLTPKASVDGNGRSESGKPIGKIGAAVTPPEYPEGYIRTVRYSVIEGLGAAYDKTVDLCLVILKTIGKMIVGEVSVDNLSGPITIAKVAGDRASYGLEPFLSFLAYLSISLGVLNLLPIPMLDGGHILYALIEVVQGKPLSERIQQAGLGIGVCILAMFMILAFYNDIMRFT